MQCNDQNIDHTGDNESENLPVDNLMGEGVLSNLLLPGNPSIELREDGREFQRKTATQQHGILKILKNMSTFISSSVFGEI